VIDDAVRRVLALKFELGLFEDPYRYCNTEKESLFIYSDDHLEAARDAGRKSIVLLKNETQLLPLSKSVTSIAVIGSLANDKDTPLGSWRGQADAGSAVSLLEGIQNAVDDETEVTFTKGYNLASGEREFTQELKFDDAEDTSGFEEAIQLAKNADVTVIAVGEECFQSGEGRSQTDISLKGAQLKLLQELRKATDNIVVVLMNGRPIAEPWMYENMPSILECWHLGSQAGFAIADVLFGDFNPAGKLPVSIPRNVGQVPISYNHNRTGRPTGFENDPDFVFWSHYSDSEKTPQYPFGFGLSYTSFKYSEFKLSSGKMKMDDKVTASVTLTNTGEIAGEEVIQLYINDLYSSTIRPVKELKGFEKISLEPGESKTVEFIIDQNTLAFYGADEEFKAEPGEFEIMAGGNSAELLTESLELLP
jgi:beta-glucosidase